MSLRHNEEEKKQWEEEKRLAGVNYSPIQKSVIREIWIKNGSIRKFEINNIFLARSQRGGGEKGKRTFEDEGQRAWRRGWRNLGGGSEDADTEAVKTSNNGNNSFVDKISWSKNFSIIYIIVNGNPRWKNWEDAQRNWPKCWKWSEVRFSHKEKNSPIHLSFFLDLIKFPFNLLFHYLLSGRRNVLEEVWLS